MQKYTSLENFFASVESVKLDQVMAIRKLILQVEPNLRESLKWNAPNYSLNGEDRITFNLMNKANLVKVVIHMGATKEENKKGEPVIADPDGIVEWNSDIRGTITFTDLTDVRTKSTSFKKVVKNWLLV